MKTRWSLKIAQITFSLRKIQDMFWNLVMKDIFIDGTTPTTTTFTIKKTYEKTYEKPINFLSQLTPMYTKTFKAHLIISSWKMRYINL